MSVPGQKPPTHQVHPLVAGLKTSALSALDCMVPRLMLEHPQRRSAHRYEGALLFADVSGFTALTEALTQEGLEGCELLSRLLGDYFTPLISQIDKHGGYLLGLAGDALSVLFHNETPGGDSPASRALHCAMALQNETARFSEVPTPIGNVCLSIKIGLATGRVFTAVVGSSVLGESLISYGPGLDRAAAAEKGAVPGDICLEPSFLRAMPDLPTTPSLIAPAISKLSAWQWKAMTLPPALPRLATKAELRAQIPPAIWPYISQGAGAFLNSIRTVSALFISFNDLSSLGEGCHTALADYYKLVQGIVDGYRGFLAGFDGGDKGNKLIALFGAPIAVENPADRAMACALDIQAAADSIEAIKSQQIGIATGPLYVGLVGGGSQRRYTALGDPMNLSARLMGMGKPGQTLMDGPTVAHSNGAYQISKPRSCQVKGKNKIVEVHQLLGRTQGNKARRHPKRGRGLVGREQELRHLRECTEAAVMGQGNIVLISGEAGLGKSRLLSPLISHASETLSATVLLTRAADYTAGSAFQPFWPILSHLLSVTSEGPIQAKTLRSRLLDLGLTVENAHIGLLLNLLGQDEEAPSDLQPTLAQGDHDAILEDLLFDIMQAKQGKTPLFLIFEDAQWLDKPSAALLARLATRISDGPFLLVLVSRLSAEGTLPPWQNSILALNNAHSLPLSLFGEADIKRHACSRMKASNLGPGVLKILVDRSMGNPLVLEELCDLLRQTEQVHITRGIAKLTLKPHELTVPKSLGELVLARMESLETPTRIVLQVASVLGQRFSLEALEAVHPGPVEKKTIQAAIKEAHRLDIIRVERETNHHGYFFKHVLARDAIYSSLTFELRRRLHGIIARYLEGRIPIEGRKTLVPIIADHYRRLDDRDKLDLYAMEAGELASKRRMNHIAATWFMLAADIRKAQNDGQGEGKALNQAYKAMRMLGYLEEQDQILNRWEDLGWALDDDPMLAQVYLAKTSLLHRQGESEAALENAEDAAEILQDMGQFRAQVQLALKVSTIHMENRNITLAQEALKGAKTILKSSPDLGLRAQVASQEGILLTYQEKLPEAIISLNAALPLVRESRLINSEAHVLGSLGVIHLRLRHYDDAILNLERAADICHSQCSLRQEGRHRFNLSLVQMCLGDLKGAHKQITLSRQLFERTDWQSGLRAVLLNLLQLSWLMGDTEEARHVATRLQSLIQDAPPPILCEYFWNLGELALREGAWQMAVGEFGNCLDLSQDTGLTIWQQQALEGRAEARLLMGNIDRARVDSDAALQLLNDAAPTLPWPSRTWHRRAKLLEAQDLLGQAQEASAKAIHTLNALLAHLPDGPVKAQANTGLSWRRHLQETKEPADCDSRPPSEQQIPPHP